MGRAFHLKYNFASIDCKSAQESATSTSVTSKIEDTGNYANISLLQQSGVARAAYAAFRVQCELPLDDRLLEFCSD